MGTELIPVADIERMAVAVAKSGLFGMKTSEQAMALMLIAQAEGQHPALAARDYHIIQNRPALKADAMLSRFQERGGKVEWHDYTDAKVSATFSHPQGGTIRIDWDMARAKQADLGAKDNWKKYPRQMLRARVISEGIRTVFPGAVVGMYTPEEVQDFDDEPKKIKEITPKHKKEAIEVQSEESPKHLLPDQLDHILEMLSQQSTTDEVKICKAFGVSKLEDIPYEKYSTIVDGLQIHIERSQPSA